MRAVDREILRLAVPAFLALVAEPLFLLSDAAIVGHLGTPQLAGLGIAAGLLAAVVSTFVFLAYGTTAAVARRVGAGDRPGALRQGLDGLWLAAGLGVAVALAGEVARAFPESSEPLGEWVIDAAGEVVAAGGLLFHYNPPYGDIFMEVAPAYRERGHGSYLVQELKRACYEMSRVPAARCRPSNVASRRTLERAGMFPCARILRGRLAS